MYVHLCWLRAWGYLKICFNPKFSIVMSAFSRQSQQPRHHIFVPEPKIWSLFLRIPESCSRLSRGGHILFRVVTRRTHRVVWGRRDDVDGEHWRTNVGVNNSQFFCHQLLKPLKKVKTGQSLSKMSKPTALHTEVTAQESEWLNISNTAKKLYLGKSGSGIAVVITTKLQTGT